MRKWDINKIGIWLFLLAIIAVLSCNSDTIKEDAIKVAEIECEVLRLTEKIESGEMTLLEESHELARQAVELMDSMKEKYETDALQSKFNKILAQEIKKCDFHKGIDS